MQGSLQVIVPALFPDRPVERQIPTVNPHSILVLDFSLQPPQRFTQPLFCPNGHPGRCISNGELFENQTNFRDVAKILVVDLRDEASLERDFSNEAFVLQFFQCFADGGLRNFEASSQLLLEEAIAGLEMPGYDLLPQVLTDRLRTREVTQLASDCWVPHSCPSFGVG